MSPTIVGLLLAIPLSWLSGQLGVGLALKRLGLLMHARGASPAADRVTRQRAAGAATRSSASTKPMRFLRSIANRELREQHEAMLPEAPMRRRGEIEPDRALAEAKLVDAETIEEALAWLKPKERMVVLHDRALLSLVMRLKDPRVSTTAAAE